LETKKLSGKIRIRMLEGSSLPPEMRNNRWPKMGRPDYELMRYVEKIICEVRKRGDAALIEFEEKFDGTKLSPKDLRVSREDIEKAYEKVNDKIISAIEYSKSRIETFQIEILNRIKFEYKEEGLLIRNCTSPIQRVGCYIPGGEAAYPSTLVMIATPAKVAGVKEIAVCSPPKSQGEVNPSILVAADICGINEIYRLGGAQAIAALAYGTQTVRPVYKIVGPGNRYVQMAKMLISRDLPIDVPAGPSEIVIIADGSADPRIVALDMLSQTEHLDAISILITTSRKLAENVIRRLEQLVESSYNKEVVSKNLLKNSLILICRSLEEAIKIVNEFAPEHLEVITEDSWNIAEKITSAGLILIGADTPVAASDYCLGTIHVLPTGGFSHAYSGLSVLDFVKRFCIAECSKMKLQKMVEKIKVLAESEGLINHSLAVEERFDNE